jgi:succinate dehydrogenase / fumarate reductase membrane anchor subunit
MTMETPLARVRGLGASGEGAEHWFAERVSALAVFVLLVWLLVSLLRLPALDQATVREWLAGPFGAVPMLLLIAAGFWHLRMGLDVVVEDYVHEPGNKFLSLVLIKFATIFAAGLAVFALLRIAFGGEAQ